MKKVTDFQRGYKDRMIGYYDKWYRYNRQDDGAEYDRGAVEASNNPKCREDVTFTPCCNAVLN